MIRNVLAAFILSLCGCAAAASYDEVPLFVVESSCAGHLSYKADLSALSFAPVSVPASQAPAEIPAVYMGYAIGTAGHTTEPDGGTTANTANESPQQEPSQPEPRWISLLQELTAHAGPRSPRDLV
jgi:hypothetical protein